MPAKLDERLRFEEGRGQGRASLGGFRPGVRVALVADGRRGTVLGEAPTPPGQDRLIRVLFDGNPETHYEYRREDELAVVEDPLERSA